MADEFGLKGVDALNEKLKTVSQDMKLKGGRFALRRAVKLVENKAAANALRLDDAETGRQIAHNITSRWNGRLYKTTGDLGFRVGVMGGAATEKNNPDLGLGGKTFHWRFKELGTEKEPAQPFMRPALEQQAEAVAQEFIVQYGKALDRAIKRAAKKG